MREIVTLQVGTYANFVGSHFWNLQDEVLGLDQPGFGDAKIPTEGLDFDTLYRQGETQQRRETYTPRLLSIDLRGSSGAVNPSGTLYGRPPSADSESVSTWHGSSTTVRAERIEKNQFLRSLDEEESWWPTAGQEEGFSGGGEADTKMRYGLSPQETISQRHIYESLSEEVQYWTDYLKAYFHPSSTYQLPGMWHGVTPFEDYGAGQELFSAAERVEELLDKVRLLVEECDCMQGFQWIVDDSGGFSAVAADLLEHVVEEYGRTPSLLFTVRAPRNVRDKQRGKRDVVKGLHDSVSLAKLASVCQLIAPLGISQLANSVFSENLIVSNEKDFHTSAVYAAAINCITLPYKMKVSGPAASFHKTGLGSTDMGTALQVVSCGSSRHVAALEASFPSPSLSDQNGEILYNMEKLIPLTPSTNRPILGTHGSEMLVLQGIQLQGTGEPAAVRQVYDGVIKALETSSILGTWLRSPKYSHLAISRCPLAIPLPFPCIFSRNVGKYGTTLTKTDSQENLGVGGVDVSSAPISTRLSSSVEVLPYIKQRLLDMRQLALARSTTGLSVLRSWGFAREEVEELSENLCNMAASYADEMESGSSDTD